MKKLLVGLLTLTTATGFAAGEHMIKLDGCADGTCDSLDFDMQSNDADSKVESQNIALNYAYSWGTWGAGLTYKNSFSETDGEAQDEGDRQQTVGVSFYWNKDGAWDNSCFAALHYDMTTYGDYDSDNNGEENDDTGADITVTTVEFGHRYTLGKMMGMNWNYVPSVSYAMTKKAPAASGSDDINTTNLTLNVANFAVTF
jgi:hypothetical protein